MLRDSVKHVSSTLQWQALTPGETDPQGDIWEQGKTGEIGSWMTQVRVDVALAKVKLHSVHSPTHPPTQLPRRHNRHLSPRKLVLLSRAGCSSNPTAVAEKAPMYFCAIRRGTQKWFAFGSSTISWTYSGVNSLEKTVSQQWCLSGIFLCTSPIYSLPTLPYKYCKRQLNSVLKA